MSYSTNREANTCLRKTCRRGQARNCEPTGAPSLKKLVRWAMECQSAEELGKKLRRRCRRQQQRRGIETGRPNATDEAELDRLLGQD